MSSRNFRRRNNRRKHRQPGEGGGPERPQGGESRPQPGESRSLGGEPRSPRPPQQGSSPRGNRQQQAAQGQQGDSRRRRKARNRRERERQPGAVQGVERESAQAFEPAIVREAPDCPVCGKPVRELPSALTHRVSGKPAHFECIMKEIRDANELAPQEKLCYLGGGSFGILQFRSTGGAARFTIRKRIAYEEKDTPQDWKKTLLIPS